VPLPAPEAGLVISFNYLWRREHELGRENARYPRPCAIVVAVRRASDDALITTVVPMTTKRPRGENSAIEVPLGVRRNLGLSDASCWIILDEANEFVWPGYDLEPNSKGEIVYGLLPRRLYERIRVGLLETLRARRLKLTRR